LRLLLIILDNRGVSNMIRPHYRAHFISVFSHIINSKIYRIYGERPLIKSQQD